MIKKIDERKVRRVCDAAVSTLGIRDPNVLARFAMRELHPDVVGTWIVQSETAEQHALMVQIIPIARDVLGVPDEFDVRADSVFKSITRTFQEFGETLRIEHLVWFGFRALHGDLLGPGVPESYRRMRAGELLCRAAKFLENPCATA
jgi:hypothetical protein